jgi:DNA-binding protein HU-beta
MTQQRVDRDSRVEHVVARTGNSAKTVEKIVDAALEEIYASIKRGDSVSLRNFKLFGWSSTYKGEL